MTPATQANGTEETRVLHVALELGSTKWHAHMVTEGHSARRYTVPAGGVEKLRQAFERTRLEFGLGPASRVVTCHEAGRDGFSLHRWLEEHGVESLVIDSSSILVDRRARRVKSDRLDAARMLELLVRHQRGETSVFKVVRAPTVEAEDARRLTRERAALVKERTRLTNSIRAVLTTQGCRSKAIEKLDVDELQTLSGTAFLPNAKDQIRRSLARLELVKEQIGEIEAEIQRSAKAPRTEAEAKIQKLCQLKGIGWISAAVLVNELFGWRQFRNRREVGAIVGLACSPYRSDQTVREQGISKAGNRNVRAVLVELAWLWLRWQPDSELTKWYKRRFGAGGARWKRIGIVALARKLLVVLWRYVDRDELPRGAVLMPKRCSAASAAEPAVA